jgi:hypothetical protein
MITMRKMYAAAVHRHFAINIAQDAWQHDLVAFSFYRERLLATSTGSMERKKLE